MLCCLDEIFVEERTWFVSFVKVLDKEGVVKPSLELTLSISFSKCFLILF